MKKSFLLLLCFGIFYSVLVEAQTASRQAKAKQMSDDELAEAEMFAVLDMKIFHDREVVKGAISHLHEQQNSTSERRGKLTEGVFNEKDSAVMEKAMDDKKIRYKVTPELIEKADAAPFEAFKDLVKNADIPKITKEEMAELSKVDEKVIPEMLQIATESGPALGSRPVSVIYK